MMECIKSVKTVKTFSPFQRCGLYVDLGTRLRQGSDISEDAYFLLEKRMAQIKLVRAERLEHYKKKKRAKLHPDRSCSIFVYGTDQSAFGLLHIVEKSKGD